MQRHVVFMLAGALPVGLSSVMAIRSQINDRYATSMGTKPMTVERQNRSLLDDGLLRRGSPGKALHYLPIEYAYLILAQAAGQPIEAAEVARALAALRADDDGQRLIDWVANEVEQAATPEGQAALRIEIALGDERGAPHRELTIGTSGPMAFAWTSLHRPDATIRDLRLFHTPDPDLFVGAPRSVRHLTTVRMDLILVAGELLADTPAMPSATTLFPERSSGRGAEGSSTPETTKDAGPGSHNVLLPGQSAIAAQTKPLSKAKSNAWEGGKQLSSGQSGRASQVRHATASRTARTPSHDAAHRPHPTPP